MEDKLNVINSVLDLIKVIKSQKSINESNLANIRMLNDSFNVILKDAKEHLSDPETIEKLISKFIEIQELLFVNIEKQSNTTLDLIQIGENMADIFKNAGDASKDISKILH